MFYCVYFFSPFHLKPVRVWLFSRVGGFVWNLWLPRTAQRQHSVYFTLLFSSLHLECSFSLSQILSLFLCGEFLPAVQGPAQISLLEGSISCLPLPLPDRAGFSPVCLYPCPMALATWVLWVVMWRSLFPGELWSPGPCFSCLWITNTLSNMNDGLLLSLEVNHNGRKICLRWVCC